MIVGSFGFLYEFGKVNDRDFCVVLANRLDPDNPIVLSEEEFSYLNYQYDKWREEQV